MSKPRPGVCGVCGRPVVHSATAFEDGIAWGHTYERGRLKRVRCREHDDEAKMHERDMETTFGPNWRDYRR